MSQTESIANAFQYLEKEPNKSSEPPESPLVDPHFEKFQQSIDGILAMTPEEVRARADLEWHLAKHAPGEIADQEAFDNYALRAEELKPLGQRRIGSVPVRILVKAPTAKPSDVPVVIYPPSEGGIIDGMLDANMSHAATTENNKGQTPKHKRHLRAVR